MSDILDDLIDLHKQATTERSHYYVAKTTERAADEIKRLRDVKRRSLAIADERAIEAVKARAENDKLRARIEQLEAALQSIKGFGDVNLSAEWEHGLRDIIRCMTDCAKNALNSSLRDGKT